MGAALCDVLGALTGFFCLTRIDIRSTCRAASEALPLFPLCVEFHVDSKAYNDYLELGIPCELSNDERAFLLSISANEASIAWSKKGQPCLMRSAMHAQTTC